MDKIKIILGASILLLVSVQTNAAIIDFEDLQERSSFFNMGIHTSYKGYQWGYGNAPGPTNAIIPTNIATGWGSMTVTDTAVGSMPTGGSGTASAWNWNGTLSLWIDFGTAVNFESGFFAVLSPGYVFNANFIQLFGYDENSILIESSTIFELSNSFEKFIANLNNIHFLEIRGHDLRQFSVDDLAISPATISATIDIKPGSDPVCNGAILVAILGSVTLDVIQIDQTTLSFEGLDVRERGNGALSCNIRDTNRDGFVDLVCQYQDSTTEGTLIGELLDGTLIEGADTFCVVH